MSSGERPLSRPTTRRALTPTLTYITDTFTVSESDLLGRLERLPLESRKSVAVQLRDPELSSRELGALAKRLRARTRELGVRLIINDRVDIARLVEADGVHLGRRSMGIDDARRFSSEGMFVSLACHSVEDVLAAARLGATAATLSPVFETPGKGTPLGTDAIRRARSAVTALGLDIGIIALGGVDDEAASLTIEAGADGVAAIRAEITLPIVLK